jgi:hypothetical protein
MGVTKLGPDGLLYYAVGGTATPSTVVNHIRDVTVKTDPTKADTSSRDSIMDTEETVGLKVSIDFEMLNRTDNAVLTALLVAAAAGTAVALKTRDYSGGRGWIGDFELSVENGQPYRGDQTYKFTATPSSKHGRVPAWGTG